MKTKSNLPRITALVPFAVIALLGMPSVLAQTPTPADDRPALLELSSGNYSYSRRADITGDGVAGGLAVHHAEISLSGHRALASGLRLACGLDYDTHQLVADGAVPLPDQLAVLSVNLGLIRSLGSGWTAALMVRPGFYSDFAHLGSSSLNVPMLVSASYAPNRELVWTFAASADRFADNPVLPVLGVRWQAARNWNIELGFPRTGLTWRASDALALRAEAVYRSDSYRVAHVPAVGPALGGTLLDFREIHAGAGCDFKLNGATTLSFDAGVVTARRFDYHERHYRLEGADAGYLKLSFNSRF